MQTDNEKQLPIRLAFQYLRSKGIVHTQQDVADMMGVKKENISRAFNGKDKYYTPSFLARFNAVFGDIFNINWLQTGEGVMLSSTNNDGEKKVSKEEPTGKKEAGGEDYDIPKVSYTKGVPYYNVDFVGGFDLIMNDQTTIPEYLIDFKKYNGATCWCNVTGHSMEPEINHGDIIALKKIEDPSFLPLGEIYAIVTTNNMRTIKRVSKGDDKDHYNLVPTNKSPEYSIQELPKNMIQAIYHVLGCMKRL